MKHKMEVVMGF